MRWHPNESTLPFEISSRVPRGPNEPPRTVSGTYYSEVPHLHCAMCDRGIRVSGADIRLVTGEPVACKRCALAHSYNPHDNVRTLMNLLPTFKPPRWYDEDKESK